MSPLKVDDYAHSLGLRGAPRRDAFKAAHKTELGRGFYAADLDLVLVADRPPRLVAFLDCKQPGEALSFTELVTYNRLMDVAPIYIVEVRDAARGPFTIKRFRGATITAPGLPHLWQLEFVLTCMGWAAFRVWEAALRRGEAAP